MAIVSGIQFYGDSQSLCHIQSISEKRISATQIHCMASRGAGILRYLRLVSSILSFDQATLYRWDKVNQAYYQAGSRRFL